MGNKTTNTTSNNTSNTTASTSGATTNTSAVNSDNTNIGLTNNTGTTQSTLPAWAQTLLQQNGSNISGLSSADPSSFVAGPSTLQSQAFGTAANLSNDPNGDFGLAQGLTGLAVGTSAPQASAGQAVSADDSSLISKYLNPNTDAVVNSTLADYDQNAAQQRAAYAAQGAANGAFGGSGFAIGSTNLDAALARARATTDSTLRSAAYQQAVAAAQAQGAQDTGVSEANANNATSTSVANAGFKNDSINRLLTAASTLQGLGTAQSGVNLANLGEQANLGATQQGLNQTAASAPLTVASQIGQLLGSGQLGLLGGSQTSSTGSTLGQQIIDALTNTQGTTQGTTTGTTNSTGNSTQTTSDPLGGLGSVLGGLGTLTNGLSDAGGLSGLGSLLALSDRRLKQDVRTVGRYANGARKVSFRYLWGEKRHVGAIAQEVMERLPQAVSRHPSGFLQVDYAMMGV